MLAARREARRKLYEHVGMNRGGFSINKFIKNIKPKQDNSEDVNTINDKPLVQNGFLPMRNLPGTTPFIYHSRHNDNESYVNTPRLSVTKLLTDRWCELKELYNIYDGSPTISSPQIELGSRFHENLESELYEQQNVENLESALDSIIESKVNSDTDRNAFDFDLEESKYAEELSEKLILRLFGLATASQTREVLVHGFLDMEGNRILKSADELNNTDAVLVSGVVDQVCIVNADDPEDLSLFESVNDWVEFYSKKQSGLTYIDLTKFIHYVNESFSAHKDTYKLNAIDVKTRSYNKIPPQPSVLNASRIQVFFYHQFFEILKNKSNGKLTGQSSLIKLATARHLDLDAPISYKVVVILLRKYGMLLYGDFMKLKEGFGNDDEMVQISNVYPFEYDLSRLLNDEDITLLNSIEEEITYDYLSPLLGPWKTPLTLRYFINRSTELYNMFENVKMGKPSIEYHNVKTGKCFKKFVYDFDAQELSNYTEKASKFWNGTRYPAPASDMSKCTRCLYKNKCPIPNNVRSFSDVGIIINDFISN